MKVAADLGEAQAQVVKVADLGEAQVPVVKVVDLDEAQAWSVLLSLLLCCADQRLSFVGHVI